MMLYDVAGLWYYYVHISPLVYTNTNSRTDTRVFFAWITSIPCTPISLHTKHIN